MNPKRKAVTIWVAAPYFFLLLVVFLSSVSQRSLSSFLGSLFDLKSQAMLLLVCLTPAGLGTFILWLLPIRRGWLGMLTGVVLALGFLVMGARIDMALQGGFERNIGIFMIAVALAGPCCAGGAFAGFLRARDLPGGAKPKNDGWWPTPQS